MPDRKRSNSPFANLSRKVFETTGFPLHVLLKGAALFLIAVVGITLAVSYTDNQQSLQSSRDADIASTRRPAEELFVEVSEIPNGFAQKLPIEKIGILSSKAEAGEELVRSGGSYAERAIDQLVTIYGALCRLQDAAAIDSQKSYRRLSEIRQQASAEGNEQRVAAADFARASAAISRLSQFSQRTDFRFAADAVLNLDSKRLVDVNRVKKLYSEAIAIHNNSDEPDSSAIFLSILADKFDGSPESEIADLGLDLKDHGTYARYYTAEEDLTQTSRQKRVQFYKELFADIEKSPPQSPKTYRLVIRLLDRLINQTDTQLAVSLAKRLGKAASLVSPKIKAEVDQSIKSINARITTLGRTLDLTGTKSNGLPLRLPNDKPTQLLFWRFGEEESMERLWEFTHSGRYDAWETNVLVACLSSLTEKQLSDAEGILGKFTVLDNETAHRLGNDIGIDIVPYLVSLDKDGKITRLGLQTK